MESVWSGRIQLAAAAIPPPTQLTGRLQSRYPAICTKNIVPYTLWLALLVCKPDALPATSYPLMSGKDGKLKQHPEPPHETMLEKRKRENSQQWSMKY